MPVSSEHSANVNLTALSPGILNVQ